MVTGDANREGIEPRKDCFGLTDGVDGPAGNSPLCGHKIGLYNILRNV